MELQLNKKSVLITGGSKGIGLATARALAAEGASLHLAARNIDDLQKVKAEIEKEYGISVEVHPVNLSVGESARALADDCREVDILVNNAGAIAAGSLEEIDEKLWREGWDLKVFGYINMMRAMYTHMKQ